MKKLILPLLYILILSGSVLAQKKAISGAVTDAQTGEALPGVSVVIPGTTLGTITNQEGKFQLGIDRKYPLVELRFVGYQTKQVELGNQTILKVGLSPEQVGLNEVTIVGSRNRNRSVIETPTPVDIIPLEAVVQQSAQLELSQILNYVAPSFSSNRYTVQDGTDHVDPASLRGLGIDHVLVLINGKRRHSSSLVNNTLTAGRGSSGIDLNTIPTAAIERIEVLRDGAAAQYGSDAIAGVINIVLKKNTDTVIASINTGQTYEGDGKQVQINSNYGIKVGESGFINLTGQYQKRGHTDRAALYTGSVYKTDGKGIFSEDFQEGDLSPFQPGTTLSAEEAASINTQNAITNNLTTEEEEALITKNGGSRRFSLKAGDSEAANAALFLNSGIPLNDKQELYVFGGINSRRGNSTGYYRLPNQSRNVSTIYPKGFLPEINARIIDASLSAGIRGEVGNWHVDLSNTYGTNSFRFIIGNTLNASMGTASPTSFDAGRFQLTQNTTNLDFDRYFDDILQGLNLALGAEYRNEIYRVSAGEEASYRNYGNVQVIGGSDGVNYLNENKTTNVFYGRPGGAQVFPGFQPKNEVDESRSNIALYADLELNFTKNFFISLAGRFEDYTDFGQTFNGKIASRYQLSPNFAVRGAFSTGFRAPSLQQRFFNNTATLFTQRNGEVVSSEVGTFRNDSRVAKLIGVPALKNESSVNYSTGLIWKLARGLDLTLDGYWIDVNNRILLSGNVSADEAKEPELYQILRSVNAGEAQLFANTVDTRTKGLDLILSYRKSFGENRLALTLAANFNETRVTDVHIPSSLKASKEEFFSREETARLETATPKSKINLGISYSYKRFFTQLNNVRFGSVTDRQGTEESPVDQTYSAKIVTDLSLGYHITDYLSLTIGANNIFNVYPDENREEYQSEGRFKYSRIVSQFGANGGYYFARLGFKI